VNLLADEGVDRQIVELLRQAGHIVAYVAEDLPGTDDDAVLAQASTTSSLLITADKDFGEMVFRQRAVHSGVVLIRLSGLSAEKKAGIIVTVLQERSAELTDAFCVISAGAVRIRRRLGQT
jgi:predicted nuclease of predicted toxin-antitoxin system